MTETHSNPEEQVTTILSAYQKAVKNVPLLKYSWVLIATILILALAAYFKLNNTDVFFYAIGVILISFFTFLFSLLLKVNDKFNKFLIRFLITCIVITLAVAVLAFGSFIIWQKPEFYTRWFPNQKQLPNTPVIDSTTKEIIPINIPDTSKTKTTIITDSNPKLKKLEIEKPLKLKDDNTSEKPIKKDTIQTSVINVISNNQSGGITANQVTIGLPARRLNDNFKQQLKDNIDLRLAKNNLNTNTLINIFTPTDAEAVNFGKQIRDYLNEQGYNVWKNLSTYMGNAGLNNLDIAFKVDTTHKQLELYLNYNRQGF